MCQGASNSSETSLQGTPLSLLVSFCLESVSPEPESSVVNLLIHVRLCNHPKQIEQILFQKINSDVHFLKFESSLKVYLLSGICTVSPELR